MNFDWSLYLELAKELANRSDDSAKRSAVSRAYYSAYNTASDFLKANNIAVDTTRGVHERVWNAYIKSAKVECQVIGNSGFRLKNARTDADYYPDKKFPEDRVKHHLEEAERVITDVPQHLPEAFTPTPVNPLMRTARCFKKCLKGMM